MSRVVRVGDVLIGGGNPITVQSMTNTKTSGRKTKLLSRSKGSKMQVVI